MQAERFHSFLPFAAWGTVRVADSPRDKAERINSSQPCFLCYVVLSFRGAECPVNHGSNWLKKPQPSNKKQIFFHVSSKFLFHMEVWDTNYSVKLRKRSHSCCLGISQRESCSECAPPPFFFFAKRFIMRTEWLNKTDNTTSIFLYMLFTGVSLKKA